MSPDEIRIKLIVLATNSEGAPEFYRCTMKVLQEQYDNGDHYDLAKEEAASEGYKEPMIAFDENDQAATQFQALVKFVDADIAMPAVVTEIPPYASEMGEAANRYHASFRYAHPLPAQWRWSEVWEVMHAAKLAEPRTPQG